MKLFKPKCYRECNPKDYGKEGKPMCWGDSAVNSKGEWVTHPKCLKCKHLKPDEYLLKGK